ncbi:MAG: hypothetical protein QXL94_05635 [Candidatus Parvarchaeum sp.]
MSPFDVPPNVHVYVAEKFYLFGESYAILHVMFVYRNFLKEGVETKIAFFDNMKEDFDYKVGEIVKYSLQRNLIEKLKSSIHWSEAERAVLQEVFGRVPFVLAWEY